MKRQGDQVALGALVGAVFTVIVPSSSATMAIIITLASAGLLTLPTGVALMLGAEVGTCADTLLATIRRGRAALRMGVFHLLFSLTSALLAIAFAPQLVQLAQTVSGRGGLGRKISNAQLLFNLIGAAAVVGFLPMIARGRGWLLPDTKADHARAQRRKNHRPPNDAVQEPTAPQPERAGSTNYSHRKSPL